MVFISFVLTIPTSRTALEIASNPFLPTREKGWPLALKKSQQGTSPFRQSGFVHSTFLSFPAVGVQPVFGGKEGTGDCGIQRKKGNGGSEHRG